MAAMINRCGATIDKREVEVKGHVGVNTGYYMKVSNMYLFLTEYILFLKVVHNVFEEVFLSECTQILDAVI